MRIVFLICLTVLITPVQAKTFEQTRRYFKDWLAVCSSDGNCSATAYDNPTPISGAIANYILRVGRQKLAQAWEISFTAIASVPQQWTDLKVTVDNDHLIFASRRDYGAYDAINDFYLVGQKAQTLFAEMLPGTKLSLRFLTEGQTETKALFSLSGLMAALLWIDEQQQRPGSKRFAGPAPVGLTPVSEGFSKILPRALIIKHAGDPDCDPFENLPNAGEILSGQVGDREWLYFIPCNAGAYNYAYKAYHSYGTYFSAIYFAQYDSNTGWTGTPFIINPVYDAKSKILTAYTKGRGLGDCGSTAIWRWGQFGLAMVEFRFKGKCDARGEPGIFPLVYKNRLIAKPAKSK